MEVLVVPADAGQPEGPEVVRKTATLPGERQRLLREAEVLQAAGERGVEGLAAIVSRPSPDAGEPCLVTAAVPGPSLAVAAPLPALEVAGVVAEVARLLAGLHEAGLVHGAVEPGHVVLDGAGGVILVGLGQGGPAGAPSSDPGARDLDPAADVAGWGALVGHLLDRSALPDEPLAELRLSLVGRPSRRGGRRRPPSRPDHDERRVLAALADQAQDPDPARRPAARSLAAAVTHRIPAARMPGAVELSPAPTPGGLLDRLAAHVTNGAPPGPVTAAARSDPPVDHPADPEETATSRPARPLRQGRAGRKRVPAPATTRPGPASAPGGSAPPTLASPSEAAAGDRQEPAGRPRRPARGPQPRWVLAGGVVAVILLGAPAAVGRLHPNEPPAIAVGSAPPPGCPSVVPPAADVDGNGCEEPVRWGDGVLQAGSARFALGGSGDAWVVGDWDCDGRRTPALLHGGALHVFDDWPAPGGELQGRQLTTVAGAASLTVVPGPGRCERPALGRPGHADLVVDARRAP